MALGPGKYDDLCTKAREEAKAEGAILVIINGEKGQGFCVQAPLELNLKLPILLRNIADDIEQSLRLGTMFS